MEVITFAPGQMAIQLLRASIPDMEPYPPVMFVSINMLAIAFSS